MMLRILRRFADRIGYQRSFAIMDRDDQQRLVKACLQELNFSDKTLTPSKAVHSQISNAKTTWSASKSLPAKPAMHFP